MHTNKILGFAVGIAIGSVAISGNAQSTYSNAVMSLNPAGYWPMHEVEAAAPGDIETNYGTLGLLGTGYYPDWATGTAKGMQRGYGPGPLTNDPDPCVNFLHSITSGSGFTKADYTNAMFIPHTSPLSVLNPPFSVECWVEITNATSAGNIIWGDYGYDSFNGAGTASADFTAGGAFGATLNWNGSWFVSYQANGSPDNVDNTGQGQQSNLWYYAVMTCDANSNSTLYLNGNPTTQNPVSVAGHYLPDFWTPLTIGGGRGGTRAIAGYIADFAIYTNALTSSDVEQKYNIATNSSSVAGQYFDDVTNDKPVIYYRMDAPATYTPPAVSAWPALDNVATTNGVPIGNGVYTPGTMPGIVPGPATIGGIPYSGLSGPTVAQLSGISSYADAGSAPVYNPTGSNANFSVTALFRGNPGDGRFESIVGHGTNSWQLGMSTNGVLVFNAGNGHSVASGTGTGVGDITTVGIYNDGNWHQVVAVNQTNLISIYVDGVLDTDGIPAGITATSVIPGNSDDVMIGSDPVFTNNPAGVGRQFAGQICDVAFFANALSAAQVQSLYNSLGVGPSITTQPASASVGAGTAFTNTVTATGNPPLYYQWYTNNVAFGGQTNASLILNPVVDGDASTNYYVVVRNVAGSETSAVVSLTVYTTPVITSQFPITYSSLLNTNFLSLYAGASPSFSVSVVAAPTIYYQWFTNGTAVSGATNPVFTTANVNAGTLNSFCIITNFLGSATSAVWSASVITDPTNSSGGLSPYPQSVLSLKPIGYWRLNEQDDGNFDGNPGALCHDYAGGNNGIYTNVYLANNGAYSDPGYNSILDPSDTAALFGYYAANNCDANAVGTNIDFGAPSGSNAEFSVQCWVNFYTTNTCGLITKGFGDGGEEFALYDDNNGGTNYGFNHRFLIRMNGGAALGLGCPFLSLENTWYHLVGVCDEANSNIFLYVNGQLVAHTNTAILYESGILNDPNINLTIGARSASATSGDNDQTIGSMNDAAIFNYPLTPVQVTSEYEAAGGTVAPYLFPAPPTKSGGVATTTLTIPATGFGTPPLGYVWVNTNTSTTVASGVISGITLNATLVITNLPLAWNGNGLELTVTNASGSANAFVTLSVTNNVNANPTNILFGESNNQLTLSWPSDHTGWQLQAQTNSLSEGISNNWSDVVGSATTNEIVIPINLTNGTVFYRLVYP
ncbi:MAG TPA: LamG-like jellyroll fold domain-containing protein [Candidatus Sulfotelmatobacter sp.]|nr:LamG-like jellyroll fold domain-containing protein [Candidatus Sulfotelmatobacter sp.]